MAVRTVWKDKFLPRRGPGPPRQPRQSNVDLAILNSQGKVVYWFDAMQHQGPPRQSLAQYTNRELAKSADQLNLEKSARSSPHNSIARSRTIARREDLCFLKGRPHARLSRRRSWKLLH